MDEDKGRWVEIWRERVLPSTRDTPALALAAHPEVGERLAEETVDLVRNYYPAPQWLDVTLLDVGNGKQMFVVAVGAIYVEQLTPDKEVGHITTGATFADVVSSLTALLAE